MPKDNILTERIENDLKIALKKKDAARVSTLRMLRAAILNRKIEKNIDKIEDSEVLSLIHKDAARHKDSIKQFQDGGRSDLAEKEAEELKILKSYMPKELDPNEIRETIREVITELNASGKKDFGKVMKASMEKLKNLCDGNIVSALVNELLGP